MFSLRFVLTPSPRWACVSCRPKGSRRVMRRTSRRKSLGTGGGRLQNAFASRSLTIIFRWCGRRGLLRDALNLPGARRARITLWDSFALRAFRPIPRLASV